MAKRDVKTVINGYKIKAGGVFDLEEFYGQLYKWFEENGYSWKETKFKAVDSYGGVRKLEIVWKCEKNIEPYVSYAYTVYWSSEVSEVEATIENVKRKMNKGSIGLKFDVDFIKHIDVWENKLFGDLMKQIYEKFLVGDRLSMYKGDLVKEATSLINEIKTYFKMY